MMDRPVYRVFPAGNTESQLEITVTPAEDTCGRSAYRFMKDYPLHAGVTFESLLYTSANFQLSKEIHVDRNVWNDLMAISAEFHVKKNGVHVDDMQSTDVLDYYQSPNKGKLMQIQGYAGLIDKSWPTPIFLHSSVFGKFGIPLDSHRVFVMDGSRRIVAGCISPKSFTDGTLIMTSSYFGSDLAESEELDPQDLEWFPGYQQIPEAGIAGWRSNMRYEHIDLAMLRDKVVIDFGCNLGQSCIKLGIAGVEHVYGLDCQADTLDLANRILGKVGLDNVSYHQVDFNEDHFLSRVEEIVDGQVDSSLFLSVYRTGELVNRDNLFRYIIDKTSGSIFFEGHASKEIDTLKYYADLFRNFHVASELIGYSEPDNTRPLFRLSKGTDHAG